MVIEFIFGVVIIIILMGVYLVNKKVEPEILSLPESSLNRIWNTKEEDEAWKNL
jgi:p-aminobenzoyl-glutamate transporter AbgT